jgi:peptide/nickel transport system substrate-binding protein
VASALFRFNHTGADDLATTKQGIQKEVSMSQKSIHWFQVPLGRRRVLQGASALGLATVLPSVGWAAPGGVLKSRTYADLRSLDPAFSQGVVDEEIHSCIYNKLIQYKPGRSWDWQLDAAAEIEQVDATHIKFTLRNDIGFTNGFGQMTAEDVKFSFERILDPALESTNKPDWGPLSHVEVVDAQNGVIVFSEPFQPAWNIALPYITGNIISKQAVEAAGGRIGTDPVATSGPYLHKSWAPKQKTILSRNPDWKGAQPDFDEIHIFPIDDEKTSEIAFEAGDIDFTRVSLGSLDRFKADPPAGSVLEEFPSLFYVWVGMNLDSPKLQDLRVRQAIQYAIDVPSILEAAYFGVAEPSTGIIAPGLIGHRESNLVPSTADFAKAQALLDEAGAQGLEVSLDILNKSTNVTAAQVIQATLAQVGITVNVNVHEAGAFWTLGDENAGDRWKDIELIMNRFSMTPAPYYATAWFTTEQVGVWNWERFSNAEFDKLHEAAKGEVDTAKRAEMYQRMQDMMEETGAYRFLTHEASPVMYRDTIKPALRPDGLPLYRYFANA